MLMSVMQKNRKVHTSGTINLAVEIGNKAEMVTFNVVERLATNILLSCDYCDRHVEAIKPGQRLVGLEDGTTVPIVRNPGERSHTRYHYQKLSDSPREPNALRPKSK